MSHGLLALAAVLVAIELPPPEGVERPLQALTIEIVAAAPSEAPGARPAHVQVAVVRPTVPPQPQALVPDRFEVALPQRVWPDALQQYVAAQRAQEAADAALLNLSPGVLGALRSARYCNSMALGIAADLHRCDMWRTRAIIRARVAALDPNLFRDADAADARRAEEARAGRGATVQD